MKKFAMLVAVFALALALAPLSVFAQAQQDTVQQSGIQIQNLSDETAANVTVRFVPGVGTPGSTVNQNVTVPANGSTTLISFGEQGASNTFAAPAGFDGSVVIESDQPVLALANLTNSAFNINEGYPGFGTGSNTVQVPLVLRNNVVAGGNASTAISVQNAGTAAVNGTITYTPGAAGNAGQTDTFTLEPGQAQTFNQFAKTGLGDLFVGSAVVSANGPVAVAVTQEGANQLLSYAGFTGASTSIALPLVVSGNTANNNFTGLQVLNTGTTPADVTFTFSNNQAKAAAEGREPCGTNGAMTPRTVTIAAGAAFTFLTLGTDAAQVPSANPNQPFDGQFTNCLYVGGATVTSSGPELVAIVNQAALAGTRSGSAYEGFSTAAASADVRAPLVIAGNAGFLTGIQIQNAATSGSPANVTVTYSPNTATGTGACTANPTARTFPLAAGAAVTLLQAGLGADGTFDPTAPAFDPQFTNCTYVGSATITSTGGNIVSVINQSNIGFLAAADNLTTYNGFNQ